MSSPIPHAPGISSPRSYASTPEHPESPDLLRFPHRAWLAWALPKEKVLVVRHRPTYRLLVRKQAEGT